MKKFLITAFGLAVMNFVNGQSGKYAEVNGLRMYYEIHGNGFPLVLIHGGGSTIETTFGRILPLLAKSNQVIAVEMQAHGHTADIDRPLSFEQDADDIAALLKHLGIRKANIFGFSNGASTTLQVAIRHPDIVNKIVVASTMYRKDGSYPWFWEMMQQASFEQMPQLYKDAFLAINPNKEALYQMYKRDVARMQFFTDIPEEKMRKIECPALIIAGNNDVVRPEHAIGMARAVKKGTVVILPGGHGDYIGEIATMKRGQVVFPAVEIIQDFLNTL